MNSFKHSKDGVNQKSLYSESGDTSAVLRHAS